MVLVVAGTPIGSAQSESGSAYVPRARLVAELRAASDIPVVLVVGGGGYGKTTVVGQWLADDPRAVAWLTATRRHDDPAVLLGDIVRVLDAFEPLEPRAQQLLASVALDFSSVLLPRLERTVAELGRPFVLVIDDAQLLRKRTTWALVQALADCVPGGSQLVVISRADPQLALGRMRADRRVHEVAPSRLAMARTEAGELLTQAGLSLPEPVIDRLWARTEGWPVGLYFATLAIGDATDQVAAAEAFAGDDRIVVDYVTDELLGVLPRATRDFLVRVSILEELRADACDATLERGDSAKMLAETAARLQVLIPLDRRGETYRLHQLVRDTLRAELARNDRDEARRLHERAAAWSETAGDLDRAVEHLREVGDLDRLEAAIWRGAPVYGGIGLTATVERWLEDLGDDALRTRPALAASKAWLALMSGDMPSLRYWADVTSSLDDGGTLPDGNPIGSAAALLRALVGAQGIDAMRADAARAYDLDVVGSPFRSIARFIEGGGLRLQDRRVEARDRLIEGEAIGAAMLPATQAQCLGQLAALAIDDDDWETARQYVARLMSVADRFSLRERPAQAISLATAALVLAHSGESDAARVEAKHALFLVSMMSTVAPWLSIETRIALARTFLLLGDVAMARTLTREAIDLLPLVPDGEPLRDRLAVLERSAAGGDVPVGVLATPMTPAEMRVLRYLPTHLTFAAIAEELFVSRNTVKTQAISIYRKLGVSSRGPAVGAARGLGLLDD